jgi:aminoglycoside phosphotransferase (APT) family kinase protein
VAQSRPDTRYSGSPDFSKRSLLNLEAKHIRSGDVRTYVSAKEQAVQQIISTHAQQSRILLDYHVENRLYNSTADSFITLDHENKGKGHPLFDLVNLLEYVELPVAWKSVEQRKKLIDAYVSGTNYISDTFYDDYAAATFLRQDAFMQAWASPERKQHISRIAQLNQNYQLFEQLTPYVQDARTLNGYAVETLRTKSKFIN